MHASDLDLLALLLSHEADVDAQDDLRWTALHHSVHFGWDKRSVHALAEAGADVNVTDNDMWTPLKVIMRHELLVSPPPEKRLHMLAVGVELVKHGADPDTRDHEEGTVLHCLARECLYEGLAEDIGALAAAGAGLEARDTHERTPFFIAASHNNRVACQKLIELGANVNTVDRFGHTPLLLASRMKFHEVCSMMVHRGCDVDGMRLWQMPGVLLAAAKHGHTHTACELIKAGAAADVCASAVLLAARNRHIGTACGMIAAGADAEAHDEDGNTVLGVQTVRGKSDAVRELIKAGANVNTPDKDGNTPLLLAIVSSQDKTAEVLMEASADLEKPSSDGSPALLLATKMGHTRTACKLIDAGARPNVHDKTGRTPLYEASLAGNAQLCCKLIRHGANVDETIRFYPSLLSAAKAEDLTMLQKLVDAGASVNERDGDGSTILHTAVSDEQLEVVKWLIEHGADVSCAATSTGMTPLHCAATAMDAQRPKLLQIVQLLLANGGDPTAKTARLRTPLQVAQENGNHVAAAVLEKAELAHQLIKAGGEATSPEMVAIRFGGPPGAGKSTLTAALRVTRMRSFFRRESQPDEGAANMKQRTKGISRKTFRDGNSSHFAILDLGGHGEFLATHQIFIGDGTVPVIDCVVVSSLDDSLEENALKWCSLFASRNQPISTPWPLLLIATRADKATEQHQQAVFNTFHKVKETFRDYFRFPVDRPLFIDARKSWSELTITLRRTLSELHRDLASHDQSPRQPAICQNVVDRLPAMRVKFAAPVISKAKFIDFMRPHIGINDKDMSEVSATTLASLLDKALQFLSGYATVLSFNQLLLQDSVVIDPHWLLSEIVGRLMAERPLPGPYVHYDNGYAKKEDIVSALETRHLPGQEALQMVSVLGFCLEQQLTEEVLNPSKLSTSRRDEHWRRDPTMIVNAGRRLKCKGTVAIAHAFFPHLQVYFYHRYLTDYEERLPMWKGGIRLVAGKRTPAEALIEAHPASMSIDIIVRGQEGLEKECADLLHSLTNETLQKAAEISPGSQLHLFFLSSAELNELSPAGMPSSPCVEYSEERVLSAIRKGDYVTDGKASRSPENPHNLLLPPRYQQEKQALLDRQRSEEPLRPLSQDVSDMQWKVALRRLSKGVNSFDECDGLAKFLDLNDRAEDIVMKLREQSPHHLSSDNAVLLFDRWLQRGGCHLTTEQRRATLARVFRSDLLRPDLAELLDDELIAVGNDSDVADLP